MARVDETELRANVARLTGDPGRRGDHVTLHRITVTSSDGKKCGIIIRVGIKKAYSSNIKHVADCLRLDYEKDRKRVDEALAKWTPEDTRKHLEQFSADVLKPPANNRLFLTKK